MYVKAKRASCSECNRSYGTNSELRRHVRKFHSEKLEEIAPRQKAFAVPWLHCSKNINHIGNEVSASASNSEEYVKRECPMCDYVGKFRTDFYAHFQNVHEIKVETEELHLKPDEFMNWKNTFEVKTNSKYVLERGTINKTLKYICHRSGFFKSKGKGIRHIKGSKKINGFCPAGIKTVETNGKLTISVVKTHVGHQNDLDDLPLTTHEHSNLASKIESKVPFDVILNEIRDSVTKASVERLKLLTKKLHHIESSFKFNSVKQMVDLWVNEAESGCVLLYKPEGFLLDQYCQLKKDDFVLIIMNDEQKTVYQNFSEKCVCIDVIHGHSSSNFELHSLLVPDDLHQGFPCAFCISNRCDETVIRLFFSCVKEATGCTKTNVFMSDIADYYFNSWLQVMEPPNFRSYCTWHIERAWLENLYLINSGKKQAEVYKILRTLLQETNSIAFNKMMPEFLNEISQDPDTNSFAVYFQNVYVNTVLSWAYCYRLQCQINTNIHIERMHRTINYICCNVKSVDQVIAAITKFVKDKLVNRLLFLNKGRVSSKLLELKEQHNTSLDLQKSLITKENDHWEIPSSSNLHEMYKIFEVNKHCGCQLVCTECNTCIHIYSCSCLESSVKWNMCKHIHLLCQWRMEQDLVKNEVNDGNGELIHHLDARNITSELIIEDTPESTFNIYKLPLNEKKLLLMKDFVSLLNAADTEEELEAINKLMKPIQPTLDSIREATFSFQYSPVKKEEPNNKIEPH